MVAVSGWQPEYSEILKTSKPHLFTSVKSLVSSGSWIVSTPNFGNLVKLLVWDKVVFRTPVIWDIERPGLALLVTDDVGDEDEHVVVVVAAADAADDDDCC